MSKIGVIISREFTERIRKKSFIIATILSPLLLIGIGTAPTLIMLHGNSDTKHIVVVDETEGHFVGKNLQSNKSVEFQLLEDITRKDAMVSYNDENKAAGILFIESDVLQHPDHIQLLNNASSSVMLEEEIAGQISSILHNEKLKEYDIENLDQILSETQYHVSLSTMKNNGTGDEESMEQTSSGLSMAISLLLGMMLYMFIIIYGQQVLTSVIEEKQSRVLDVMVTSCRPFELMMGKILGIAAVAAVQIGIWCVLISTASAILVPMIPSSAVEETGSAVSALEAMINLPQILLIFLWMLLFMVGGFLLYASLFAAAGSAVDANQDAQQFNTIIMMPIIIAIVVMMSVFNDPSSGLVFWFSMIPFTSPIVMMARIPFDIPVWEIVLSLCILYATFVLTTWIAAKIYRIGIFMHGKKPSWRELGTWLRM